MKKIKNMKISKSIFQKVVRKSFPRAQVISSRKLFGLSGYLGLSILENGTVLACRRLPIPIGKVPHQRIRDIFILSRKLNEMRRIERLEKCKDCELLLYCRGCRAVTYGITGDYFKPDPQCWK